MWWFRRASAAAGTERRVRGAERDGAGGFAACAFVTRGYVAGKEVGAVPVSTERCLRSVGRVG